MPPVSHRLKPRKTPVQARSQHTVDAVFTATIQVLLDGGLERLTTTRVAERAGVSVGSLYQYFPNKHALLAAVLSRHLEGVVSAVEAACAGAKGAPVAQMAQALVDAFMDAKLADPQVSRALHAVAAEVGGEAIVARVTQRAQLALCDMLATAADRRFDDLALVSFVLSTTLGGPVQALLQAGAGPAQAQQLRAQLARLATGYLLAASTAASARVQWQTVRSTEERHSHP